MKIRKATKKDIKALTKLFNESKYLWGADRAKIEKYTLDNIKDYFNKRNIDFFIICEEQGKIIGTLLAQLWRGYAYLHTLVVSKKHKDKGIGTALMDFFEKEVKKRKLKLIEVEAHTNNKIMFNFLKERKFKIGEKLTFFYKEIKK